MSAPDEPVYFAHVLIRRTDGTPMYLHASPSRRFVELHGMAHPIVTLRIRERVGADPPSDYWGWLGTDKPDYYAMIWPSEIQARMCFPYGPEAETARGRGRMVNLHVELAPA